MPQVPCPNCQRPLNVAEENLGKKLRCAACKTVFQGGEPPPMAAEGLTLDSVQQTPNAAQPPAPRLRSKKRRAERADPEGPDGEGLEDARAVRARPTMPPALNRAAWLMRSGAVFVVIQGLVLAVGELGLAVITETRPGGCPLVFGLMSVVVAALFMVGSFHFHPKRTYMVAMLTSVVATVYGIFNILPCVFCSLALVAVVGIGDGSKNGTPNERVFMMIYTTAYVLAGFPAILLSLVGGIYGAYLLRRYEFKRLYLD